MNQVLAFGQAPRHYPPPLINSDDKLKEVVELLKFMRDNPTFLTVRLVNVAISIVEDNQ